jgi:hypothetical protein
MAPIKKTAAKKLVLNLLNRSLDDTAAAPIAPPHPMRRGCRTAL